MTLAVARAMLPLLRQAGYTVVLSRNSDTLVARSAPGDRSGQTLSAAGVRHDLAARVACANAANAQILLAVHFNADNDPSVNGAETIYDAARPFSAANKRLATLVQAALLAQLRGVGWVVPDRGVQDDLAAGIPSLSAEGQAYGHLLELGPSANGGLSQPSAMPGVLVEPFFLTHPAEADVTASKEGQQDIALGLEHGIDSYFPSAPAAKVTPTHR
jgi:N-acetylmuramoyl-L-alanine amidase